MSDIVKRFETRLDQGTLDNLEILHEKFQKEVWPSAYSPVRNESKEERILYNKTIVHVLNNYLPVEEERNALRKQVEILRRALVKGLESEKNKEQFLQLANEALDIKKGSH